MIGGVVQRRLTRAVYALQLAWAALACEAGLWLHVGVSAARLLIALVRLARSPHRTLVRWQYAVARWAGQWAWRLVRGSLHLAAAGTVYLAAAAARLVVHAMWATYCWVAPQQAAAVRRRAATAAAAYRWMTAAAGRCCAAVALHLRWAARVGSYAHHLHQHMRRVAAHATRLRGWRAARAQRQAQARHAGALTIRRRALGVLARRRAAAWRVRALVAARAIGRGVRTFVGRRRAALAAAATAAAPSLAAAAARAARAVARRGLVLPLPPPLQPPPPPILSLPSYERDYALEAAFGALPPPPPPLPSDAARRHVALANQADVQQALVAGATTVAIPPPPVPLVAGLPANRSTVLVVAACDAVTAALTLHRRGAPASSVAVLNFADPVKPGGGYVNGRTAQEEDLCRAVPALFPALATSPAYPLDPATSPVVVHAEITRAPPFSSRLPAAAPVTVVTAAAPNGNSRLPLAVPLRGVGYEQDFTRRMRYALYAAHAAGCSTIVLGAWGCGVFGNRPQVVADLWSEVLDTLEWRGRFARVVFAIPHGTHGHSLATFRRALRPLAP